LDTNTDYYLDLVSKGVGKPKEELAEFLRGPRYFRAQEAIDYGLADTILHSLDGSFKPKVPLSDPVHIYVVYIPWGLLALTYCSSWIRT
jgi:hypothetical protein